MKLDFRIDWGYQYIYSRRLYHPTYIWDGILECEGGTITEIYKLEYPFSFFAIGNTAKELPMKEAKWEDKTKRGFSGIRVVAEVTEDSVFTMKSMAGTFVFNAKDIMEKGRVEYNVGHKYLGCMVIATLTDYFWFRQEAKEGETVFEYNELGLTTLSYARTNIGWLNAGESVSVSYDVPKLETDYAETLYHLVAMAVTEYNGDIEGQICAEIPFELYCDGEKVAEFKRYFRHHDGTLQLIEDEWVRVQVPVGEHTFELKNCHPEVAVGINRISLTQKGYNHGELSIPEWALVGENMVGKVFATHVDEIEVQTEYGQDITVVCTPGWNEFTFVASKDGVITFTTKTSSAEIEVIDCEEEERPVKVGYDMTLVPHDGNGFMDWLLDYTSRTRLGNYIHFRSFNGTVEDDILRRWGNYCRTHGIYVSACNNYLTGAFPESAGEMFHDCGPHEFTGWVYAVDPEPPHASTTMKEAAEKYIAQLKACLDEAHTVSKTAAFGDASGGTRYSYLAGADFVRAETTVANLMPLLAQARPAAEALGDGSWGVHIAVQHNFLPYRETHFGQYFLFLMQSWAMGAEALYEEDSLFSIYKEEREAWDDLLTKGKRDMTRRFFKFAKTHPRKGICKRNIANIEGRWAAPFNGFICGSEQDPHYSVWGGFGNEAPEWGHGQPEKCRQILDVLMPGAATLPFLQRHDKRRFFFTGTPYGDFDSIPVEATADYYSNYELLVSLGWNTMIEEDYTKLMRYVEDGGVLLTGIPQFSTHLTRDFLSDMKDLALMNDGDLSQMCGIKVNGPGVVYSGQWNCMDREYICESELSAMPSDYPCEDGKPFLADVELCGAEIVAWDSATGAPMLVKHKVGKGEVYTFTLWAYPGHEQFMHFAATWLEILASDTLTDVYVEDGTGEIFWTRWVDGDTTRLMMLNTDWTRKGNKKEVSIVARGKCVECEIEERTLVIATVIGDDVSFEVFDLNS